VVSLNAAGSVADFDAVRVQAIAATFARAIGASPDNVTVIITAGSVRIHVEILAADASAAEVIRSGMAAQLSAPSSATQFLEAVGVTIMEAPSISISGTEALAPAPEIDAAPAGVGAGGIVGIGIGILVVVSLLARLRLAFVGSHQRFSKGTGSSGSGACAMSTVHIGLQMHTKGNSGAVQTTSTQSADATTHAPMDVDVGSLSGPMVTVSVSSTSNASAEWIATHPLEP
jgi:hypothetical protein